MSATLKSALSQPPPIDEISQRDELRFESFLSDLSAAFINAGLEDLDQQLQAGLRRLVEFLDVDRGCLISAVSADGSAMVLASYSLPGIPQVLAMQPLTALGEMQWYAGELAQGRTVRIRSIEDLPPQARAE